MLYEPEEQVEHTGHHVVHGGLPLPYYDKWTIIIIVLSTHTSLGPDYSEASPLVLRT